MKKVFCMVMRCLIGLLLLMTIPTACGPGPTTGGFDSPNPAARAYAIQDVIKTYNPDGSIIKNHDPVISRLIASGDMNHLIVQLGSSDPLLRFMSINALEELTGTSNGYRDFDLLPQRWAAIQVWVRWTQEQSVRLKVHTPTTAARESQST